MISALMSPVIIWEKFFCSINSTALIKWYVWLSGSSAGITRAKNKVVEIKIKNPKERTISDLSSLKAFNKGLVDFKLKLKGKSDCNLFLFLNKIKAVIKVSTKVKIKILFEVIALNKDKISKFRIISAKNRTKTEQKNVKKEPTAPKKKESATVKNKFKSNTKKSML